MHALHTLRQVKRFVQVPPGLVWNHPKINDTKIASNRSASVAAAVGTVASTYEMGRGNNEMVSCSIEAGTARDRSAAAVPTTTAPIARG